MSAYTQQANILLERLPETEQQFIVELMKKMSGHNNLPSTNELNLKLINQSQREAVKNIMETLDELEPLADDELDEILIRGISFRSPEELDLL
jgi:hypothetical protein